MIPLHYSYISTLTFHLYLVCMRDNKLMPMTRVRRGCIYRLPIARKG